MEAMTVSAMVDTRAMEHIVKVPNEAHSCIVKTKDLIFSDVNECLLLESKCHTNASCTNTDGSYRCGCYSGFFGDGFNCTSK